MTRKIASPENLRRIFLQQAAGCCMALGMIAQARAQTMVADTEAQATALGYKTDAGKVDKACSPSMPPASSATTAPCIKAPPVPPRAAARCSGASMLPVRAGAMPGLRKADSG